MDEVIMVDMEDSLEESQHLTECSPIKGENICYSDSIGRVGSISFYKVRPMFDFFWQKNKTHDENVIYKNVTNC